MFSWLGDILGTLGESISSVIFDTMLRWFYDTIYGAAAAFLAQVGSLGTEIFDLDWVQAFVRLFGLLAWALTNALAKTGALDRFASGRGARELV